MSFLFFLFFFFLFLFTPAFPYLPPVHHWGSFELRVLFDMVMARGRRVGNAGRKGGLKEERKDGWMEGWKESGRTQVVMGGGTGLYTFTSPWLSIVGSLDESGIPEIAGWGIQMKQEEKRKRIRYRRNESELWMRLDNNLTTPASR
jgi:hypothetical protein